MPQETRPNPTNAVILEKIENLRCDIGEVNTTVKVIDNRQQGFEKTYVQGHTEVVSDVKQLKDASQDHEERLKELEKTIAPLVTMNKILAVIGGILLTSMIGLIWAIITHTVTIGVP